MSERLKTGLFVIGIILVGFWVGHVQTNERNARAKLASSSDRQICQQVQGTRRDFRDYILQAYDKAERDLGKPGSAGSDYYRKHPAELLAAIHSIEQAKAKIREKFRPKDCRTLPSRNL